MVECLGPPLRKTLHSAVYGVSSDCLEHKVLPLHDDILSKHCIETIVIVISTLFSPHPLWEELKVKIL